MPWHYHVNYCDRTDGFGGNLEAEIDAIEYFNQEVVSSHYDPVRKCTVIIIKQWVRGPEPSEPEPPEPHKKQTD